MHSCFLFSLDPLEYGEKCSLVGAEGKYKCEAAIGRRDAFNAVLPLAGLDVFSGAIVMRPDRHIARMSAVVSLSLANSLRKCFE